MTDTGPTLALRVKAVTWEAPNVLSYRLQSAEGEQLPAFTAGAHIDLKLPNMFRSYSLLNPQSDRTSYAIAVLCEAAGRGGSKWIHEHVHAGGMIDIKPPENNFPLDETASRSVFIAGGIGITPMLSMIDRLSAVGLPWELHYCYRSRALAPFVDRLSGKNNVTCHFDDEAGGRLPDLRSIVERAAGAHLYCCGPAPMLASFESLTAALPQEQVHTEYFSSSELAATDGGFKVVLGRSGKEYLVARGKTILETLREAGHEVAHSCLEGVCGTCETKVLDGIPDHRDMVLTESERASGRTIMICCSGAKSDRLVLDL
jgi:vanillate O-demethylase ferredoxin subunit